MGKENDTSPDDSDDFRSSKPGIHYHRFNITLSLEMNRKWNEFAKSIGLTTAGLIRSAVNEYIKRSEQSNVKFSDIKDQEIKKTEAQLNEKLDKISELMKNLPQTVEMEESKKDRLKSQVIEILTDSASGVEPKKLAAYCGVDRKEMLELLGEMQGMGLILIDKGKIKLVK